MRIVMEGPTSLLGRIHSSFMDDAYLARPLSSLKTNEIDLVRGVLQILQGNSNSLFSWDQSRQHYHAKVGVYVVHLSMSSLHDVLTQFLYAASCLRLVDDIVSKIEVSVRSPPTLRAFASSVSVWLKMLRDIALKEEMKINNPESRVVPTLLGMVNSLSSLCSGTEYLFQVVYDVIPQIWTESVSSVPATEVAVHILDYLYKRLYEVCLVEGGEEDAYWMLLYLFAGSILPYIQRLDSWIYEGILDDPFNEMYFYENKDVSLNDTEFWEKSYLLKHTSYQKLYTDQSVVLHDPVNRDVHTCPVFLRDISRAIVSAGKSLQLIRHVPLMLAASESDVAGYQKPSGFRNADDNALLGDGHRRDNIAGLTLSEIFCISLSGLVGHGDHVFNYFQSEDYHSIVTRHWEISKKDRHPNVDVEGSSILASCRKIWVELLSSALNEKKTASHSETGMSSLKKEAISIPYTNEVPELRSFCPENLVVTVSQKFLNENRNAWSCLNLSKLVHLPSLNDEDLWDAVFGAKIEEKGTNHVFGFRFTESECCRAQDDGRVMETLFPFPTILPSFEDNPYMSELLPFQKNNTISSRFLSWIEVAEPRSTPLPAVIMQECLTVYIKQQVDYIGGCMLSKLLNEWRLMDELQVLRAIYLLGSGDLLQHFLTVIFNRLDKGESWDDDFELNMILQESITNSADYMILSAPDSLVVSIIKPQTSDGNDPQAASHIGYAPRKLHEHGLGISGLDILNFMYKVSWPLELIANAEAIKKYNQVMCFLLKVKRAKYVLDKTRRLMWKNKKGTAKINSKHHWLVEQKLLHFVEAFHQYVMDRVYHSAWRDLCKGLGEARSLDEVIEVHDAYLLSIQRQCFVIPDKLWALIASRINTVLGLALEFCSIQQTLSSGGPTSAMKSRCEMEVDRIEKQFDDCIAFLLRVLSLKLNVGHFPHLADLVTRINYNYYYMSDSGNVINAPGSEAVKMSKSFPLRTAG